MENNWIMTDPDCCQYILDCGNDCYKMIQYVQFYLKEPGLNIDVDKNFVVENEVNLRRLSNDDICSHISSYGYSFVDLIKTYKDATIRIIAECVLENTISSENIIAEFRSKKEAVNFIKKYIGIDNYTNV